MRTDKASGKIEGASVKLEGPSAKLKRASTRLEAPSIGTYKGKDDAGSVSLLLFSFGDGVDVSAEAIVFCAFNGATAKESFVSLGRQRLPILATHVK